MSSKLSTLAPVLLVLVLAGCNTVNKNIATEDPYIGEAVAYDNAIQVINPDPVYPEDGAKPGDNGEQAAKNVKAYREGEVLQKHNREARQGSAISTTSSGSGGPQ